MPETKSPLEALAQEAAKTLLQNRSCLVATFFRKFPGVNPASVRLVSQIKDGRHYCWVEFPRPNGKGLRRWPNGGCREE